MFFQSLSITSEDLDGVSEGSMVSMRCEQALGV